MDLYLFPYLLALKYIVQASKKKNYNNFSINSITESGFFIINDLSFKISSGNFVYAIRDDENLF